MENETAKKKRSRRSFTEYPYPLQQHSIKVSKLCKEFFLELDNINQFVNDLIENSREYKSFVRNKKNQNKQKKI